MDKLNQLQQLSKSSGRPIGQMQRLLAVAARLKLYVQENNSCIRAWVARQLFCSKYDVRWFKSLSKFQFIFHTSSSSKVPESKHISAWKSIHQWNLIEFQGTFRVQVNLEGMKSALHFSSLTLINSSYFKSKSKRAKSPSHIYCPTSFDLF